MTALRAAGNCVDDVEIDGKVYEVHYTEGDRWTYPTVWHVYRRNRDLAPRLSARQIAEIAERLPAWEGSV